ncbi:MAG: phenylalanine--tRNA ligase beta subunit-related protein [Planctomycetota bacterium]
MLDVTGFVTQFGRPFAATESPGWLLALLDLEAEAPFQRSDDVRAEVRNLLRHGGYKPTGRGKPASEYLVRAVGDSKLGSINIAVDACNVVSLHSGLPISVVDLDRVQAPLRVAIAAAGSSYEFNQGGQVIDVSGLLCLFDSSGPCANAVKDSQRTKTAPETQRTLSIVWGTQAFPDRAVAVTAWYRELLERAGCVTTPVTLG